ncbi:hypothetical protein ACN47E_005405 [Coniothyrium glycines]
MLFFKYNTYLSTSADRKSVNSFIESVPQAEMSSATPLKTPQVLPTSSRTMNLDHSTPNLKPIEEHFILDECPTLGASPASAHKNRERRDSSPAPTIYLTGFICGQSNTEYDDAKAATGNDHPYWFREDQYSWCGKPIPCLGGDKESQEQYWAVKDEDLKQPEHEVQTADLADLAAERRMTKVFARQLRSRYCSKIPRIKREIGAAKAKARAVDEMADESAVELASPLKEPPQMGDEQSLEAEMAHQIAQDDGDDMPALTVRRSRRVYEHRQQMELIEDPPSRVKVSFLSRWLSCLQG